MLICKLEGLDKPEGFINRTANRKIIDCYLPQNSLLINYEQAPKKRKKTKPQKHQTSPKVKHSFRKTEVQYFIMAVSCDICITSLFLKTKAFGVCIALEH